MSLSVMDARALLQTILQEWWGERAQPILGAQLKARMLARSPEFDEQSLGYRSFAAFVSDSDGVAVKFRERADFIAVPQSYENVLEESSEQPLRIRADFWRAFVSFPVIRQVRAYDKTHDQVVKNPPETLPAGAITITPIPAEEQLGWRRSFVQALGPDSPLADVLSQLHMESGFRAFSQALELHPELRRRWNIIWANHVAEYIQAWASSNGIQENTWLTNAGPIATTTLPDVRKRIYAILDTIPVEHLLDLQLPVRWFLDIPPPGGDASDH